MEYGYCYEKNILILFHNYKTLYPSAILPSIQRMDNMFCLLYYGNLLNPTYRLKQFNYFWFTFARPVLII